MVVSSCCLSTHLTEKPNHVFDSNKYYSSTVNLLNQIDFPGFQTPSQTKTRPITRTNPLVFLLGSRWTWWTLLLALTFNHRLPLNKMMKNVINVEMRKIFVFYSITTRCQVVQLSHYETLKLFENDSKIQLWYFELF